MPDQLNMDSQLRPRELALLLLASADVLPRKRARDQQADRAGLALKRQMLDRLISLDPPPDAIETTLVQIVDEVGPPTGPARAIAGSLRDDWEAAVAAPQFVEHLLAQALRANTKGKRSDT